MDIAEWLEEQECDLLHMIDDWFESRDGKEDMAMTEQTQEATFLQNQTVYRERDWRGPAWSKWNIRTVRNITREANYQFGEITLYGRTRCVFRTDEYDRNEWDLVK